MSLELPELDLQPRVKADINALANFIARQYRGDPAARRRDMVAGILTILRGPVLNDVSVRRRSTGLELRRHNVAQFAIIYAYHPPSAAHPQGLVSVRAVRHSRVQNVFRGVHEVARYPYRKEMGDI